jgi:hypothetical protein
MRARVFSVGVGSAVSEGFVRSIANRTGGAAAFVTPGESMSRQIERHFLRIATPASEIVIDWGSEVIREQLPGALFEGDTEWVFATVRGELPESVGVEIRAEGREPIRHRLPLALSSEESPSVVARVAARNRLERLPEHASEAVAYRLLTEQTACAVVHERAADEKLEKLPELVQVPQMLAAGWGGTAALSPARYCESIESPYSSCWQNDLFGAARLREDDTADRRMENERRSIQVAIIGWAWLAIDRLDPDRVAESLDFPLLDENARRALEAINGFDAADEAWLVAILVAAAEEHDEQLFRHGARRLRVARKRFEDSGKIRAVREFLQGAVWKRG